jgi:hypothetical protein
MANAYTPPEGIAARERALGKKLTLVGVVLGGVGVAGIVASMILNALFLGILGGPISSLAWLSLLVGAGLFFWGFNKIKYARSA